MKKAIFIVIVLLVMITFAVVVFKPVESVVKPPVITTPKAIVPKVTPTENLPVVSKYYYPMSDFNSRIKYRWFGKYVNAADKVPDCGATFVGYHDAVDLEVTQGEKAQDVPVYAAADGTVRLLEHVSGYGGLLVFGSTINGQPLTFNYGHINLASTSLKVGDEIKAGQKLALLGAGCSTQTDGERKHLHFAIHKGSATSVAGYVNTQAALNAWIDPKIFLGSLSPNQPK